MVLAYGIFYFNHEDKSNPGVGATARKSIDVANNLTVFPGLIFGLRFGIISTLHVLIQRRNLRACMARPGAAFNLPLRRCATVQAPHSSVSSMAATPSGVRCGFSKDVLWMIAW